MTYYSRFQAHLEKTENEILELSHNAVNLKQNFLELTELKHVLEKAEAFFTAQEEIGMETLTKSTNILILITYFSLLIIIY